MRYLHKALLLCLPLLVAQPLWAVTDAQYAAIAALGELNGVALHCGYTDETRRMKGVLVRHLPKRRQLGDAFDQTTHQSFLKFIADKRVCPEKQQFTGQVDTAIEMLQKLFP